mgnify:CR=1 FL=1
MQLEPGAILASPQGRERLTIADTYVSPRRARSGA